MLGHASFWQGFYIILFWILFISLCNVCNLSRYIIFILFFTKCLILYVIDSKNNDRRLRLTTAKQLKSTTTLCEYVSRYTERGVRAHIQASLAAFVKIWHTYYYSTLVFFSFFVFSVADVNNTIFSLLLHLHKGFSDGLNAILC